MPYTEKMEHNQKIITYFLGFICFVIFVFLLVTLKTILIPITIAIFLTFLFHPILQYLKKFRIPKSISLLFIFLFLIAIYILLMLMLQSNINSFLSKGDLYLANLNKAIESILSVFNMTSKDIAVLLHFKSGEITINEIAQSFVNSGLIPQIFNSVTALLEDILITLLFWVLMIMGKDKFEIRLKIAFANKGDFISQNIQSLDNQLQNYIFIKTVLSLATGIITSTILWILGIDFPIIWGVLAFIFNYIPSIGATISIIFPLLIALLQYGFGVRAILVGSILFILHNLIGNLLEPQMMGKKMDLSPVYVLFSLFFWGWIWGIPGMFLAVPIASIVKILCSIIDPLKPIAIILGGNSESQNVF